MNPPCIARRQGNYALMKKADSDDSIPLECPQLFRTRSRPPQNGPHRSDSPLVDNRGPQDGSAVRPLSDSNHAHAKAQPLPGRTFAARYIECLTNIAPRRNPAPTSKRVPNPQRLSLGFLSTIP